MGLNLSPGGTLHVPQIATTTTEDHHATIIATTAATAVSSSPQLDVNNSNNNVLNSHFHGLIISTVVASFPLDFRQFL